MEDVLSIGISSEKQMENRLPSIHPSIEKPWLFKPGQSGNPAGRPPGRTLKEYTRAYLAGMTDEERLEFLRGLHKETIWKMAEGNPKQDIEAEIDIHEPSAIRLSE